jgi:molecular chaperone DnaJ
MATTTKKDYYEILGVPRTATAKEIKAAYRKLARKHHPDVNKGDPKAEERFKEVAEAFAVLSDKDKRARYDRSGHDAFGPEFDPFAGFEAGDFSFGDGELSSIFEMFGLGGGRRGGGARRQARARRGEDLRFEVQIPFLTAMRGGEIDVAVPRQALCATCEGRGTRPGSGETTCPQCGGSGRTEQRRGPMQVSLTCPACQGAGRLPGEPCPTCGGSGRQASQERMRVRIPPGIDDGGTLRLSGKGNVGGPAAPAGDAYLTVRVEPHPIFRREGRDLHADVAIGLARAGLGGRVDVSTLEGTATITVPPGTRSGQRFRLRGRGVPASGSRPAGDLYAVVQIEPPKRLDARSRELLEEFERLNPAP